MVENAIKNRTELWRILSTTVETMAQTMENGGFSFPILWKTLWIVWTDFPSSPLAAKFSTGCVLLQLFILAHLVRKMKASIFHESPVALIFTSTTNMHIYSLMTQ